MSWSAHRHPYRVPVHVLHTAFATTALALAFVLPASGQPFADRTDGRIGRDGLSVGVFADVADAQAEKLERTAYTGTDGAATEVYLPVAPPPSTPTLGAAPGSLSANDPAFLHDPRVAPRPTLFEGVLYASNNPAAHNTLLITVAAGEAAPADEGCAVAEVRGSGEAVAVRMAPTSDGYYQAFVRILDPDAEEGYASSDGPSCGDYGSGVAQADTAAVLARHDSEVSIRVAGAGQVSVEVDGEGPEFSYVEPEGRREAHTGRITFEVRDRDSGLRHDGEPVITPDGDYKPVNADGDNETFREPLSVAAGGAVQRNGNAADIDLQVAVTGQDAGAAPDITNTGGWEMLGDRPGVAYFFSADAGFLDVGRHRLGLRAVDRAGNVSESGSVHDDTNPSVMQAWTGIAFDHQKDREVLDRSWIMLDFGEPVSDADVVSGRVVVIGNRVVEVVHSHAPEGGFEAVRQLIAAEGDSPEAEVDPRSRLYIRLARPLRPGETPAVALAAGALQDVAGNANDRQVITPRDGIAPRFTVRVAAVAEGIAPDFTEHEVTAAAAGRPLANGKESFVVDVTSDEELAGRPEVYFTGIRAEKPAASQGDDRYAYEVGSVRTGGALFRHDEELHWRRTYTAEEFKGFDGLFGLVVTAEDAAGNTAATPGWTPARHRRAEPPARGDALDLAGMDGARLLLEVDRRFNGGVEPGHDVTFRRHDRDDSESERDLLVRLDFSEEGQEYAVCPSGGCTGGDQDARFRDSHGTVTVTEITLDGDDAMHLLARLGGGAFELFAYNPSADLHEVEYKARDEAGNERSFDVHVHPLGAPEPPYEVDLSPGWNLISLPGTPASPALRDVVPSDGLVTPVLSYRQGDWVTAVLDNGSWRGRLEEVTTGYGYWLHSIAAVTIATPIPGQDERQTLPSVPVTPGWNLLGVMDLFHNRQGEPPGLEDGNGGEADHYFASIPWRTAYTYDTPRNRWVRITPQNGRSDASATPEIVNGRGYWVWSGEPSTLVP